MRDFTGKDEWHHPTSVTPLPVQVGSPHISFQTQPLVKAHSKKYHCKFGRMMRMNSSPLCWLMRSLKSSPLGWKLSSSWVYLSALLPNPSDGPVPNYKIQQWIKLERLRLRLMFPRPKRPRTALLARKCTGVSICSYISSTQLNSMVHKEFLFSRFIQIRLPQGVGNHRYHEQTPP